MPNIIDLLLLQSEYWATCVSSLNYMMNLVKLNSKIELQYLFNKSTYSLFSYIKFVSNGLMVLNT